MVTLQQFELTAAHRGRRLGGVVIRTQHVQDAMNDQKGDFVLDGSSMRGSLTLGHGRADDHITQEHQLVSGIRR
jgi:hypothetical protein